MDRMFNGFNYLKILDLSNFNTSSVKDMEAMFYECYSLVSLNLNNFDTSKVEDMGKMFYGLKSLKILDLSNFNTSSVKYMYLMFEGCNSLVSLNLNNFDTSKVENMGRMFYGCTSLIYLNLYSFTINESKTKIEQIFNGISGYICYNNNTSSKLSEYTNSCDNICFNNNSKLIIDNKTCIDECFNDNIHKHEYKNICFQSCSEIPQKLYGSSDFQIYYDYNKIKCLDKIQDGYFCNDTDINTLDKCKDEERCSILINSFCKETNYYTDFDSSVLPVKSNTAHQSLVGTAE